MAYITTLRRFVKRLAVAGVLVLGMSGPVAAESDADQATYNAAVAGDPAAQNTLGIKYEIGLGVPMNDTLAMQWYRKAAQQGLAEAQFNLAAVLIADLMVGATPASVKQNEKKFIEAYMWVSLAANAGHEGAAEGVRRLAKLMTPADLAKAQKMAREWKPKK